jgi:hypothetical protein
MAAIIDHPGNQHDQPAATQSLHKVILRKAQASNETKDDENRRPARQGCNRFMNLPDAGMINQPNETSQRHEREHGDGSKCRSDRKQESKLIPI